MRAGSQAAVEREVIDVACALHRRGSVAESVSLLRAAVCRDSSQAATRELLDRAIAGEEVSPPSATVELGYGLVDGWIRRGMLVEALALLSGTSLGSKDKGREWATLLGELLAPVPVDAEESLRLAYRQLMRGGASVALTLLDERDRKSPALPAWARRRLEVLRWLLLDNAEVLEHLDPGSVLAPSELAAALGVLPQKGLVAGHAAMKDFVARHPDDGDAARTLEALDTLVFNLEEEAGRLGSSNKTMPMVGHVAAMMQLRMGNLYDAVPLYERLIRDQGDERAQLLLGEVELLLRVLDGQPLDDEDEPLAGEATQMRHSDPFLDEPTLDDYDGGAGATMQVRLPEFREDPVEESGKIAVTDVGRPDGIDASPTLQQPSADEHAERLVELGRIEEAEQIYRGLLEVFPESEVWSRRADELARMRTERQAAAGGVLVRVILPVK